VLEGREDLGALVSDAIVAEAERRERAEPGQDARARGSDAIVAEPEGGQRRGERDESFGAFVSELVVVEDQGGEAPEQ
jgi:hypothetical protein